MIFWNIVIWNCIACEKSGWFLYKQWVGGGVQLLSRVWLCNHMDFTHQALLYSTVSLNLLKFMSTELMMPSNCLILSYLRLLLPSILPSIRIFSNELALCLRWPKDWRFSFSISPSNEYSVLMSFRILQSKRLLRAFSNTTVQKYEFFSAQFSLWLSVQFSSVAQSCLTLCDPMNCSTNSRSSLKLKSIESVMPSSHLILLSSPSPAPNPSQHQSLLQWVSSSLQVAKGLELQLQHQSIQWKFRTDFL